MFEHGTPNGYNNHACRCDDCRKAWNAYNTKLRAKRVQSFNPVEHEHGLNKTYDLGCRCQPCRDAAREYRYAYRYGLDADKITKLRSEQQGRCACCNREKTLVPDHDHETGKVRGLLCHSCNTGIGKLGDNLEGLTLALEYLKQS